MGDLSSISFASGLSSHRGGRDDVKFTPDGRIIYAGVSSLPDGRRPAAYQDDDYYSHDEQRERRRYHETRSLDRPHHPGDFAYTNRAHTIDPGYFGDRGYDNHRHSQDTNPHEYRGLGHDFTHQNRSTSHPYKPDNNIRENDSENSRHQYRTSHHTPQLPYRKRQSTERWCSTKNPYSFVFIFSAILIFVCAIVNTILCNDKHYYSGFWIGIMVLEFGIVGVFHRGNYRNACRNWSYIIFGAIAGVLVFIGSGFVMSKVIPDFIYISVNGTEMYVKQQKNYSSHLKGSLQNDSDTVWVCLAFDSTLTVLYIFDYFILMAVCLVMNKYINNTFKVTGRVQPWCSPMWFNPYGQVPVGEFVVLLGIVVRYACQEGMERPWYRYWAPCWAGAMLIVGGNVCALAMKRPDQKGRAIFAMFLQLFAILSCIAAFVLHVLGIVDNANTLKHSQTNALAIKKPPFIGSAVIYGVSACVLLFSIVYSVSLFFKVSFMLCDDDPELLRRENRSYTDSSSSGTSPWIRRNPSRGYQYGPSYLQRY